MITARKTRRPIALLMASAGAQVIGVELVEAAFANAQLFTGLGNRDGVRPELGQDVAYQWRGATMQQLKFFIATRIQRLRRSERMDFFALG